MRPLRRPILFLLAAAIQVAAVAWMVVDRAAILRSDTEVLLETLPIDPRNLLRGDYVVLRYDISSVPAGTLKDRRADRGAPVFVTLAPAPDGFHRALSVHSSQPVPGPGQVVLRGRVASGDRCGADRRSFCEQLRIDYGLESFFVPEGDGQALEQARGERRIAVVASVTASGRAAIKRLTVDGRPIYDEPLF